MKLKYKILIILLIVLSFFIFSNFVSAVGEQITNSPISVEVYTIERPTSIIIEQTFVRTKTTFLQGEAIVLEDFQDIFEFCNQLDINLLVKDNSGRIIFTHDEKLGSAGYMTLFVKYSIVGSQTRLLNPETYTAEANWICDGKNLGKDGSLNNPSVIPSKLSFKIIEETQPIQRPDACQIDSCNSGYILQNTNSNQCFCEPQFTLNDGMCDLGENKVNSPEDCGTHKVFDCQQGLIVVNGLCVNPDNVCQSDGGNVLCNKDISILDKVKDKVSSFFSKVTNPIKSVSNNLTSGLSNTIQTGVFVLFSIVSIGLIIIFILVIVQVISVIRDKK